MSITQHEKSPALVEAFTTLIALISEVAADGNVPDETRRRILAAIAHSLRIAI